MSKILIVQDTLDVIEYVAFSIDKRLLWKGWRELELEFRIPTITPELSLIRNRLLFLNDLLQDAEIHNIQEAFHEYNLSASWLFYEEEEEVIPIYDEAVSVAVKKIIVKPTEIANLLAFMGIPGTKSGIDVENHDSKGYHFHYGKIKRDALDRYDVLMTFDKRNVNLDNEPIPNIPLHVEPHAAGKCTHIDASTIGHNRRLPIYLVCEKAMKSRGLENFLSPSKNSSTFYPMA